MPITYEKIDATKAKKIVTTESEIVVADLEAEIATIKNQIALLPQEKTVPDEEARRYWNMVAVNTKDREILEDKLADKEAELVKVQEAIKKKAAQAMGREL